MVEANAPQASEAISQTFKHLNFTALTTFNRVTSNDTNDNDGLSSNGKMIAVNWKSTSTVAVFNADRAINFDANVPLLKGHTGNIFDQQWSPFEDRLLATCADDGKVKFWVFDDYEGITNTGTRTECDLEIEAHARKCISVQWHAAAENLLATHSIDKTIKIWDINEDRCDDPQIVYSNLTEVVTSVRWSPDGSKLAAMVKNK